MEKPLNPETNEIRMSSGRFLPELIFRFGGIWMLSLCIISVAGLALGIVIDLRWFVLGLMLIFVVLPMIISFMYYYYGLRRECYVNTLPHRIRMQEDGLAVTMVFKHRKEEKKEDSNQENPEEETGHTEEPEFEITEREEIFPYSMLNPMKVTSDSAMFFFRKPRKGFIWIPVNAFDDPETLSEFLERIDKKISDAHT